MITNRRSLGFSLPVAALCGAFAIAGCIVHVDIEDDRAAGGRERPTCAYGEEDFRGGVFGYCTNDAAAGMTLRFVDVTRTELLRFAWPAAGSSGVDCETLCHAGALEIAYSTDRLELVETPSDSEEQASEDTDEGGGGCAITPDGALAYPRCDGQPDESCHGACGVGCVGCQIVAGDACTGDASGTCRSLSFQCYQRPCCAVLDGCLVNATTLEGRIQCHLAALADGCGLRDAKGRSYRAKDTTCLPMMACIRE